MRMPKARLVSAPLLLVSLALFAGCFQDPSNIVCTHNKFCPEGNICNLPPQGGPGVCCKSSNGVTCTGQDAALAGDARAMDLEVSANADLKDDLVVDTKTMDATGSDGSRKEAAADTEEAEPIDAPVPVVDAEDRPPDTDQGAGGAGVEPGLDASRGFDGRGPEASVDAPAATDAPGTGGVSGNGGTIAGGSSSTGGATAASGIGGASATGGSFIDGGAGAAGGASSAGGTTAAGGSSSVGGETAMGGTSSAGGAGSTGGVSNSGGATLVGGASSSAGGTTATGGTTSNGGSTSSGGSTASGGSGGTSSSPPPVCAPACNASVAVCCDGSDPSCEDTRLPSGDGTNSGQFVRSADTLTVTDTITGLQWQTDGSGSRSGCSGTGALTCTWDEAKAYCAGLSLGGFDDWRLPARMELFTILDLTVMSPAINTTYFPDTQGAVAYWTSTPQPGSSPPKAWTISFGYGASYPDNVTFFGRVRCVR